MDALFYYRFLNIGFLEALRSVREHFLNRGDPPYPCQWDDAKSSETFGRPWGNGPERRAELSLKHEGPDGESITVSIILNQLATTFSIDLMYLRSAFLHGTPVIFQNLYIELPAEEFGIPISSESDPPLFKIVIYRSSLSPEDETFIDGIYRIFLGKLSDVQAGAQIIPRVFEETIPSLEFSVCPPYFASPKVLIEVIKEALAKCKSILPPARKTSFDPTVRVWTVYLLTQKCGLTNRQAIFMWNDRLGNKYNHPYTIEEGTPTGPRGGKSSTSIGESQFSRDKSILEQRIHHYEAILTKGVTQMS